MSLSRRTFLAATSAACALPQLASAASVLNVVATTGMIADTARQIGGAEVAVRALMGPGVDPHSYRQTRSDIVAMTRADLVLWHGLDLEAQMEEFLLKLARRTPAVAVGEAVPRDQLISHEGYEDRFDPHIWMAPDLWAYVSNKIAETLTANRPDAAASIEQARADFIGQLAGLHDYGLSVLDSVPEKNRVIVTSHDAFGYLGRSFGIDVVGIQGISTESEAGLSRISEIVDMLVDRNVRAVFVESSVPDRNVRSLIEGAGAKGHDVSIGGTLYSDAMGPDGTYEATYVGMLDHNFTTISRALGGTAPATGMIGKLTLGT